MDIVVFFALAFMTASSGALFRPGPDYERLIFPSWRPPNYLFGPVWAVLFIMIAVSGWLIWRSVGFDGAGRWALIIYALHLVLNFLWSAIFFGLKWRGLALIEMALLWGAIVYMIFLFHPISPLAAWLLVPYLLWVSFAFCLNYTMWQLNRSAH